jgi:RNA polymerase sigma-70 factor, ECF subfamily
MDPLTTTLAGRSAIADGDRVRRAARGDTIAFEQLVTANAERAYRIAHAILGSDADARDAVQESFLHAWQELPRLREVTSFEAWMRRIVVNACRTQLRHRQRVREISLDVLVHDRGTAVQIADEVGDADLVARAFDRLNPDNRAILVLHYVDDASVGAIAHAMGAPAGTIKWRLSRARAALQRAMLAEGEGR